jgi:hypothetical protein
MRYEILTPLLDAGYMEILREKIKVIEARKKELNIV